MPEITVPRDRTAAAQDDPLAEPIPTRDDAEAFVAGICFKIGPPRLAGIELERLVYDPTNPTARVPVRRLASALGRWSPTGLVETGSHSGLPLPVGPLPVGPAPVASTGQPLPAGAAITVEPGGQVELSTQPWGSIADCLAAASADADAVRAALARAGLAVGHAGIDPFRSAVRTVDKPRYAAMERYFDKAGAAGRLMMASTASVQVSVDAGTAGGDHAFAARWHTLHAIGPVLVALFGNSPVHAGAPTGWHSTRQRVWIKLDPGRTTPSATLEGDPRDTYAALALAAPLLCLPNETDRWDAPPGVTFLDWMDGALDRPATYADLEYHLSTLFPPVRAKGYLEVRYLDAQPGEDWRVPPAVIWTLLSSPALRDAALAAVEPVGPPTWPRAWAAAARDGLTEPRLAKAARALMEIALGGLTEAGLPAPIRRQVAEFAERHTFRGRSPADDQLDALALGAGLDRMTLDGETNEEER
jgi:glutamate--cysteine ligase